MNKEQSIIYLSELLYDLRFVKDSNKHHKEPNVFNHSIQVFDAASASTCDCDLIFSSLFHDVGKSISIKNHEVHSVELVSKCNFVNEKIIFLIKNHLRVQRLLDGIMKKEHKILSLKNSKYFNELIMLRKFDVLGRESSYSIPYNKDDINLLIYSIIRDM